MRSLHCLILALSISITGSVQANDRLFVETDFAKEMVRVRPWYQHNDQILSIHLRYNVDGPGLLTGEIGHAWSFELNGHGKMIVLMLGGPVINTSDWYLRGIVFDTKLSLKCDRLRLFSVFNFVGSTALERGVGHGLYTFTNLGFDIGPMVLGASFDAAGEVYSGEHTDYFTRVGPQLSRAFADEHFFVSVWYSFDLGRQGAQHVRLTVGGQW